MRRLILLSACLVALTVLLGFSFEPVQAGETDPADWVVEISTQELHHYLQYAGSIFKPLIIARVVYFNPQSLSSKYRYEDIFYHNGEAIGCRRKGRLAFGNNFDVSIFVAEKSSFSASEKAAAANAIVRLLLDLLLKGNMVTAVVVPDSAFTEIVEGLKRQNFDVVGQAIPGKAAYGAIVIRLNSSPSGLKQTLCYYSK